MDFKEFYERLISLAEKWIFNISVKWEEKETKAMAEYYSVSGLEYIKIIFKDKSFLYVVPWDEEIYYSKDYVVETWIKDEEIWNNEIVKYNEEEYFLDNKNDYQFVRKIFFWDYNDIEWEVKFSDYVPKEWDDFLSLGWIVYWNKRADIHPSLISIYDIKI